MNQLKQGATHTSIFAQATAAQYLKSGRMPATLDRVRKVYDERALAMGAALLSGAVDFARPQGGLFFWARLTGTRGKTKYAGEVMKKAIGQGVAFVPGAPFYESEPAVSTFPLSFATADVGKITEGIQRLKQAMA